MKEWWKSTFDQLYIDTFSKEDKEVAATEVEQIEKILRIQKGDEILDLCCGYGRHSILLAKKGYKVTGLDFSQPFLEKAQKDTEAARVKVHWIRKDMRDIPLEDTFDAVINIFTSFGYFETDEENFKVLKEVSKCLKLGGKFLIDTINREYIIKNFQSKNWNRIERNGFVLDERQLDLPKSRILTKNIFIDKSNREEWHLSLRLYTLTEMIEMLKQANLEVKSVFGDLTQSDYTINSKRMIVLAEKY
jgi:SAM-dependent methyltransferase